MANNSFSGSLVAAGLGVVAFFASFVVLYTNEGRADLSRLAEDAVVISGTDLANDSALQNQLVSVTGQVTSNSLVGDSEFLPAKKYLTLHREVEIFAWKEISESSGSDDSTTTYRYETEWMNAPIPDSSEFNSPAGHENPRVAFSQEANFIADSLKVGVYTVDGAVDLPNGTAVPLSGDQVILEPNQGVVDNEYIYLTGSEELLPPKVGDVRISFTGLEPGFNGTVLGALSGENILSYTNEDGDRLWRVFMGTQADAVAQLHGEFVFMTWMFRLLGFLLMWFGLASVLGLFTFFLNFIPILGQAGRFVVAVLTFGIALVLSIITIIISSILHSLLAVIVVGVVIVAAVSYWIKQKYSDPVPAK